MELTATQMVKNFPALLNPKVHYCVHKREPLIPILSQINPLHNLPPYLSQLQLDIYLSIYGWVFQVGGCHCVHLLNSTVQSLFPYCTVNLAVQYYFQQVHK